MSMMNEVILQLGLSEAEAEALRAIVEELGLEIRNICPQRCAPQ